MTKKKVPVPAGYFSVVPAGTGTSQKSRFRPEVTGRNQVPVHPYKLGTLCMGRSENVFDN